MPTVDSAIGIFGPATDPEVRRLREALRARRRDAIVLDPAVIASGGTVAVADGSVQWRRRPLDSLRAVYLRLFQSAHDPWNLAARGGPPRSLSRAAYQAARERAALSLAALEALRARGVRLVNDIDVHRSLQDKAHQLGRLRRAGLSVPATLVTDSPAMARAFVRERHEVVIKPLAAYGYARVLRPADLAGLARRPAVLQRYIDGPYLRATVVDGVVVSEGEYAASTVDVRGDPDLVAGRRRMAPHTGDAALVEVATAAAKACALAVAGVDLVRSKAGYVVLECNPAPAFTFFEAELGHDIAGPIADLLVRLAGEPAT